MIILIQLRRAKRASAHRGDLKDTRPCAPPEGGVTTFVLYHKAEIFTNLQYL
jgi:hypothetical protein